MPEIKTLRDIVHGITNALSIMSSHAQYVISKMGPAAPGREELKVIYDEAERAARLLSLVPQAFMKACIRVTTDTDAESREKGEVPDGETGHGKMQG